MENLHPRTWRYLRGQVLLHEGDNLANIILTIMACSPRCLVTTPGKSRTIFFVIFTLYNSEFRRFNKVTIAISKYRYLYLSKRIVTTRSL